MTRRDYNNPLSLFNMYTFEPGPNDIHMTLDGNCLLTVWKEVAGKRIAYVKQLKEKPATLAELNRYKEYGVKEIDKMIAFEQEQN